MSPTTSTTVPPQAAEPQAGGQPVPVWLFIGLLVLLYWGMVYFDQNGGWFSTQVYAPYHSEQEVASMWPTSDEDAPFNRGRFLFNQAGCAACHMETGVGNPANGCPPLVGSEWVTAKGPNRLIRLVSKGGGGPIEVGGKQYNGTMLAVGDQLPGDEKEKSEKIADILFYVRKNFGKVSTPIKPEQVMAVREKIKARTTPYTAAELSTTSETE